MNMFQARVIAAVFVFLPAGTVLLQAQDTYRIAEYMPNQLGDSLQFQNIVPGAKDPILIAWPDTVAFRKQLVLKRTESTGSHRLETIDVEGWKIWLIGMGQGREMIFDHPLILLPAVVEHGAAYKASAPFSVFSAGRKQGSGALHYEIQVEGNDSSSTPLQNFADCLVLSTLAIRSDPDGVRRGYEIKEWYAKGFGLVKMAGEAFTLDAKGGRSRVVKAAGVLEKAMIGGQGHKWQ